MDIDTANEEFSLLIEKKKRNVLKLSINKPLNGNLNLSILTEKGFSKIEVLHFVEGHLTSITNIPATIKKLIVAKQSLKKIELPSDIEHLEIQENVLEGEFSLENQKKLKYLNVSFNKIKSFSLLLPETLEELYCQNNLLKNIYLKNCPNLRVFYCKYNDEKLKIYNIPDTTIDISLPDTVNILEAADTETEEQEIDKNDLEDNYKDSLEEYFNIKQKYEKQLFNSLVKSKQKKKKMVELPKCYGCKRNVGMVFSGKNKKYTAYCGDSTKPCDWKIVLHRGDNYVLRDLTEELDKILEETKENIIRQKMDTLFNLITEEKSSELFKTQISLFKKNSEMVEEKHKLYEELYFNPQKKDIIQKKHQKIQEKLVELNNYIENKEMIEAVNIQLEIKGISEFIQRENYEYMEMWFDPKRNLFVLDQQPVIYSKLEINQGEPVKVE